MPQSHVRENTKIIIVPFRATSHREALFHVSYFCLCILRMMKRSSALRKSFADDKSQGDVLIEDVHRVLEGEKTGSVHSERRSSISNMGKILRNASSHLRSSIRSAADSCASSIFSDDGHMLFDEDSCASEDSFPCDSSSDLNFEKLHIDCDQTCDLSTSESIFSQTSSLHPDSPMPEERAEASVLQKAPSGETASERIHRLAAMMNVDLSDDHLPQKPQVDDLFSSRLLDKSQSEHTTSSKKRSSRVGKAKQDTVSTKESHADSKAMEKGSSTHSSKSKHKRTRSSKKSDKKKSLESKSKKSGSEHKKRSSEDPLKKLESLARTSNDVVIVPAMDESNPFLQLQVVSPVA